MNIDWNLAAAVGMPIITLFLGVLINHLLESRPKLVSHLGFISAHRMGPNADGTPGAVVHTHSVIIKNTGRRAATNVRLGHNLLPNVNVYPDTDHEIRDLPGGGKEIVFPTLVPKKEVSVNYLYFAPTTWGEVNTHVESDDGPAKVVPVLLQPQAKPWVRRLVWALLIVGLTTCVYLMVDGIRWLLA
ncbi:hypothetical protein [Marinobacter sp. 1_MG-2023]|uniref:hypothetical protein n=1 Tax=Marinobacter sp. 1_MG-2023 TaxID=3062627 RepID=UPI0026E26AAC|nr:hypothetical protein [Marinobacter sp. 1_MG-2023]MDO6822124.1 hypothetical protein [Marinobacter sp. 1_MG-2023]